jgi:hypothetical protein
MRYTAEVALDHIIHILRFMKISLGIQIILQIGEGAVLVLLIMGGIYDM